MPWKNRSPICGEKAGSAGLTLPREAVGRFNESYPHGLFPIFKEVRLQLALSQADLARELGVSYATVNRWENGQAFQSGPCPAGCLLRAYDGDRKVKSSGMVKNGLNPIGIWIEICSENQSMKFSE